MKKQQSQGKVLPFRNKNKTLSEPTIPSSDPLLTLPDDPFTVKADLVILWGQDQRKAEVTIDLHTGEITCATKLLGEVRDQLLTQHIEFHGETYAIDSETWESSGERILVDEDLEALIEVAIPVP